jgi:hypothetical protein
MSRTIVGRDFMSNSLFGNPGSRPQVAQTLALSEDATAIPGTNSWTTFGGSTGNEISTDGLARAVAVYAHTSGTQIATLQKTFTHTGPAGAGTAYQLNKCAVVGHANGATVPGAADAGIFVFITNIPNPPTLVGTDSMNLTESIDFGA